MGLTSCRWITIAGTLAHRRRDADRYTLICDEPLYFLVQEVTDLNMQYWLGRTGTAEYVREIDLRDEPTVVPKDAWLGNYVNGAALGPAPGSRADARIDFNWATGVPATGANADNFSVSWQSDVKLGDGWTNFNVTAKGGVRLYVDGRLVLDQWANTAQKTWTPTIPTFATSVINNPGSSRQDPLHHRIEVRYRHQTGAASVKVSW